MTGGRLPIRIGGSAFIVKPQPFKVHSRGLTGLINKLSHQLKPKVPFGNVHGRSMGKTYDSNQLKKMLSGIVCAASVSVSVTIGISAYEAPDISLDTVKWENMLGFLWIHLKRP